ncbi:MAG: ParB/RepB/Spo0J family partition protein [Lentisphaerae bacterium]|nr:ParB/RepB/Spo0J family partition protein [Lentisphaerota bacterium]
MSAKKITPIKKKTTPVKPAQPAQPAPVAKSRRGLGRGLGSLIESPNTTLHTSPAATPALQPATEAPRDGLLTLPVGEISRSPWQPRSVFNPEALAELAESIKAHGVIQPLICRKTTGGGHELVAGERRLRAAIEAGLERVPVVVINAADRDAAEMAVIENIQREDLNIIEEAEGYRTLADNFNLTQQEIADRVGKSRPAVTNAMRLLDLPDDVKQLLSSNLLSTGHAKVLLGLDSAEEQMILSHKCVTEGLTVRSLERAVARRKAERDGTANAKRPTPDLPDTYLRDLVDRMHRHFGTHVRLTASHTYANGKRAKGSIELDFYDNDDLDRLLSLLGIVVD